MHNLSHKDALSDIRWLRTLVEILPDYVYVKDTEGRYVLNNFAHAGVLGTSSPEEIAGKSDFDFYPEELAERYRADEQEIIRSGRALSNGEQPSVDGEGNQRWHSTTKAPLRDGDGRIVGLLGVTRDVTEQREAEEALRRSEATFRSVVHNSTEIVKIVDPNGTLRYASPAFERVLGYEPNEAIGMNVLEYVHPDDLPHVLEETEKALGETSVGRNMVEYRFRHKDGSWRHMESIGTYLLDEPAIRGVVVNARDVTERKRVEEELHDLQREYEELVDSVDAIIWKGDPRPLRFTFVSHQAEAILGYPAERWTAEPSFWPDHIHPEDREWAVSFYERAIEDKRSHSFEYRMISADGNVVWLRDVVHMAVEDGVPTQLFGVMIDITERKRAEKKLGDSEKRFRSLIQNASDVVAILDEDGTIRYDSPAVERVLGYRPEERVEENTFDYLHPDDRKRSEDDFTGALAAPGQVQRPVELRLRHKDGSWRCVETIRTNLLNDPAVKGVVANYRDVTERKRAEERLKESEERHRVVVEQSMEGVYLFDPNDGRVLESNGAFEELLGYTADELLGMTIYDFIAHERENIDHNVRRDHMERRRDKGERKYRRKDGSLLDVEASATVVPYGDEEAVCCVVHDVTERKEAEEALRKSEARLVEAQRIVRLGNWEWNVKTGEIFWSDEVFRIYGYEPKEFEPTLDKLMEVVHPGDREMVEKNIEGALHESEPYEFEHRIVRPEGEERVVHRQAKVYFDEEGEPARMVGTVHDVTERKEAEARLRESEERFRSAFEDAPIGVALVSLDGRRLRVNRALCEMLGYQEEELLGKDYAESIHPDDREISADHLRRVLEKGEGSYTLERRYMHADGYAVWNLTSVSLIQDARGDPSHLVCLHQDITERKALEEHLEHQAFHDSLTGLPNRALLLDRLGHALDGAGRKGGSVAVLLVDLDDFKMVNDSLGHDAGNAVLVGVARRLKDSVRPGDTVGRMFGDEFAVLLEAPAGVEEAQRVAERIQEGLRMPFEVDGREVFVSPSIGIARGETVEDQPKEVLRQADLAMYAAKSRGKAAYEVYSPSMNTRVVERLDLDRDLRRAIEREEFEVHYQPVIELSTGRVEGFEALARWRHPERGLIPASEFIVFAEETGLIRPIGQRAIEEACRQAKEWHERYPGRAPRMSVNLSASQFSRQPDLIPKVLDSTGLDPKGLQLEITERVVMDDAEFSLGKLRMLKSLGISFAIDDYGMGYSCLYYLKHMPVDYLKIDRAFIAGLGEGDPGDEAIVSGTIGLAHALGLRVVAEGVETQEQLAKLKDLRCDLAQGYYFAEPLPGEAANKLLEDGVSW